MRTHFCPWENIICILVKCHSHCEATLEPISFLLKSSAITSVFRKWWYDSNWRDQNNGWKIWNLLDWWETPHPLSKSGRLLFNGSYPKNWVQTTSWRLFISAAASAKTSSTLKWKVTGTATSRPFHYLFNGHLPPSCHHSTQLFMHLGHTSGVMEFHSFFSFKIRTLMEVLAVKAPKFDIFLKLCSSPLKSSHALEGRCSWKKWQSGKKNWTIPVYHEYHSNTCPVPSDVTLSLF